MQLPKREERPPDCCLLPPLIAVGCAWWGDWLLFGLWREGGVLQVGCIRGLREEEEKNERG